MKDTIGFIGLGNLGFPIAANLLGSGYGLRVYNRTASKADPLVARGAERVERPGDAAVAGGILVTLLWDDAAVESVLGSHDLLEGLGEGGLHLSMSTLSPDGSKALAALHARHGSAFVEAPVFGRPEAAVARTLSVPFAGSRAAKDRVRPVLEAMGAQTVFDFGEEIGAATTVKLVANFLIGSAAASLTEGLLLVEKSGFDPKAVVDILGKTLFPAPIYQAYGRMIADGIPIAGKSAIPRKDLDLFKRTAQAVSLPAPVIDVLLGLRNEPSQMRS